MSGINNHYRIWQQNNSSAIALAFSSLLEEYQQGKSKIATKEEEARLKQNQELLAKTSDYTVDRIVNDLASLQLSFGNVVNNLANKLTTESNKQGELARAIAMEQAKTSPKGK